MLTFETPKIEQTQIMNAKTWTPPPHLPPPAAGLGAQSEIVVASEFIGFLGREGRQRYLIND